MAGVPPAQGGGGKGYLTCGSRPTVWAIYRERVLQGRMRGGGWIGARWCSAGVRERGGGGPSGAALGFRWARLPTPHRGWREDDHFGPDAMNTVAQMHGKGKGGSGHGLKRKELTAAGGRTTILGRML
eukprot:scaffold26120_cov79-Isochrysis_galbana.AAC.1